jgi:hypothetical protein
MVGIALVKTISDITSETCIISYNFLIEKKGKKNPLAIESASDIS